MNCQRAEDLFIDYLYGELGQEEAESVQAHLDECQQCSVQFSELTRIRELVGRLPDQEPTQIAVNRVIVRAREEADKSRQVWRFGWLKVLAPLCIVAIVTGVVAYQYRSGMLSEHLMHAPARQDDRTVLSRTAPSSEQEGRIAAPSDTRSEKESAAMAEPRTSPDEATMQEDKMAGIAPVGETGNRGAALGEKSYKALTRAPVERETTDTSKQSKEHTKPTSHLQLRRQPRPTMPTEDLAVSTERLKQGITEKDERLQSSVQGIGAAQEDYETMAKAKAYLEDDKPGLSIAAMLEEAEKALKAKNYKKAADLFSAVVQRLQPGNVDRVRSLLGLARAQEGQGNLAEARHTYRNLAKESPAHRDLAEHKIDELADSGGR